MYRLARAVTAAALMMGIALIPAGPAEAATPRIEITKVYYNSPGSDKGSNSSLNAEWVRLTNRRAYTINLKGWTLRDKANHVYTFQTDFKLAAGKQVWIHTGTGTNTATDRYWGKSWYVWNNNGDKAFLRRPNGDLVDTCSWGSSGSYTYCK